MRTNGPRGHGPLNNRSPPPFFFRGGGEGFHQPNLAKMEFHPGFRHSHGLHSAKEGVKYTRTYCLLKMRVASTLLPLHHPHHIHIITAEQPTMNSERERHHFSLSSRSSTALPMSKCQGSLPTRKAQSQTSVFKDHTSSGALDASH